MDGGKEERGRVRRKKRGRGREGAWEGRSLVMKDKGKNEKGREGERKMGLEWGRTEGERKRGINGRKEREKEIRRGKRKRKDRKRGRKGGLRMEVWTR